MKIEEARKFLDGELLAITLEYKVSNETQKKRLESKFAALNLAVGAIDKQIPKKADTVVSVWGKCPNCGIDTVEAGENYCYQCGQALDWSVEND